MRHYTSEERGSVDCLPPALSAIAPQKGGRDDSDGWRGRGPLFRKVFPGFAIVGECLFPANNLRWMISAE
eukprot:12870818-Prorocentrum_lima.AAC.1